MELLRMVVVVAVVPLLLLVVECSTCAASFPGSIEDEVPATDKQEAGPPPVGCVAPRRRLDALLIHALRLHSANGEELDVVRCEGRRDDVGEGAHVRGHPGKGGDFCCGRKPIRHPSDTLKREAPK